jgi:hypothetical protein
MPMARENTTWTKGQDTIWIKSVSEIHLQEEASQNDALDDIE